MGSEAEESCSLFCIRDVYLVDNVVSQDFSLLFGGGKHLRQSGRHNHDSSLAFIHDEESVQQMSDLGLPTRFSSTTTSRGPRKKRKSKKPCVANGDNNKNKNSQMDSSLNLGFSEVLCPVKDPSLICIQGSSIEGNAALEGLNGFSDAGRTVSGNLEMTTFCQERALLDVAVANSNGGIQTVGKELCSVNVEDHSIEPSSQVPEDQLMEPVYLLVGDQPMEPACQLAVVEQQPRIICEAQPQNTSDSMLVLKDDPNVYLSNSVDIFLNDGSSIRGAFDHSNRLPQLDVALSSVIISNDDNEIQNARSPIDSDHPSGVSSGGVEFENADERPHSTCKIELAHSPMAALNDDAVMKNSTDLYSNSDVILSSTIGTYCDDGSQAESVMSEQVYVSCIPDDIDDLCTGGAVFRDGSKAPTGKTFLEELEAKITCVSEGIKSPNAREIAAFRKVNSANASKASLKDLIPMETVLPMQNGWDSSSEMSSLQGDLISTNCKKISFKGLIRLHQDGGMFSNRTGMTSDQDLTPTLRVEFAPTLELKADECLASNDAEIAGSQYPASIHGSNHDPTEQGTRLSEHTLESDEADVSGMNFDCDKISDEEKPAGKVAVCDGEPSNDVTWTPFWDDHYSRYYFYNSLTQETTWDPPPGFENYCQSYTNEYSGFWSHENIDGANDFSLHSTTVKQITDSTDGNLRVGSVVDGTIFTFSESVQWGQNHLQNVLDHESIQLDSADAEADTTNLQSGTTDAETDTGTLQTGTTDAEVDFYGNGVQNEGSMEFKMSGDEINHDFDGPIEFYADSTRRGKKALSLSSRLQWLYSDIFESMGEHSPAVLKYWLQRFHLFSKFDEGVKLDEEGWFSVTPEAIAKHQASRCEEGVVVDAFTGVGGNAIQFALAGHYVIAIDMDPKRVEYAQHNAMVYGVADRTDFIVGDFFKIAPTLNADIVFLSPPWGGPEYQHVKVYDIETMLQPKDGTSLFKVAKKIAPNIVLFLPRNVNIDQLKALSVLSKLPCEVERNYLNGKLKAVTAYYGNFACLEPIDRPEDTGEQSKEK